MASQGGQARGGAGGGTRRSTLDVDAIEGYARRLSDQIGRSGNLSNPRMSGGSGLSGAASGLAGMASGLAGGGLASRIVGGRSEAPNEDFETEVRERLDLMDERLRRLEDEVSQLGGGEGATEDPAEPAGEYGPEPNP